MEKSEILVENAAALARNAKALAEQADSVLAQANQVAIQIVPSDGDPFVYFLMVFVLACFIGYYLECFFCHEGNVFIRTTYIRVSVRAVWTFGIARINKRKNNHHRKIYGFVPNLIFRSCMNCFF